VKAALTVLLPSMVKVWEGFVPATAPDHPLKTEVASGVSVIVTVVPDENTYEQVEPQLIPPTSEVTVPPPVPDFEMESV
jgi:hypothetical protein